MSTDPAADDAVVRLTGPGGPFEIREQDVLGVRVRAYQCGPWTLREVFEQSRAHGERDYLVYDDERYTFADTFETVAALAHCLADRYGIGKGDRVAIAMRNYPEFVLHFWAVSVLGAVAVPLNAWWTGRELQHGIEDSGAVLLVADDERLTRVHGVLGDGLRGVLSVRTGRTVAGVDRYEDLRENFARRQPLPPVALEPDDLATILYTSGTTGRPRGAVHTHRNHCTNLLNTKVLGSAGFAQRASDGPPPPQGGAAAHMPLFHISTLASVYLSASSGSKIALMYKWDTERALDLIETERLNSFSGVPMQAMSVFDSPSLPKRDLSSLKTWGFAGTTVPLDLVQRVRDVFGGSVVPRTGYGMTEATSAVTFITGAEYWAHPDSVGHPSPVNDVRLAGADGQEVPIGEVGEIWVRGPNVVRGYWNEHVATSDSFLGGWHRTGDLARADEAGRLYLVDRVKDMIIRAGENVYCAEVEAVLHEHPAVHTAVVVGVPHERLGEEVAAAIRLHPGQDVPVEALRAFTAERLAHFKVPSYIVFVADDLPRTATGKIVKRDVRTNLLATVSPNQSPLEAE